MNSVDTPSKTPVSIQDAPLDYQWIDTDQALAELCEHLLQQPAIALDTEFVRTRTYFPHIGLLQVADTHGVYLIDPLAIDDHSPFAKLLVSDVVKVVHACSEDLEVFQFAFGVLPVKLFDTQVAAGFAGFGASIGYANLVRETKGIEIPKHETRSDWLQRPLSDAQLRYAALDVVYLLSIYEQLVSTLSERQRLDWVVSDSEAMVTKLASTNNAEQYFLRIRSAWKLKPDQLAVLKAVCRWRERQAREQDRARGHILKDSSVFDIALKLPLDQRQLKRIQDISPRFVEHKGHGLCALISDTLDDQADYPERLPKPLNSEQTSQLKQLKSQVGQVAKSLELPQELLVRKKDYEALIRSKNASGACQLPESLQDWREQVVGSVLLDCLHASKGDC